MNETLWIENPMIFIKDKGYLNFIPDRKSSKVNQINSLTLMLIYLFIVLYLFKLNNSITNTLIFGIIFIMVVLYYGYYSYTEDLDSSANDINNISIESGYYDSNGDLQLGPFYSRSEEHTSELQSH